MSSEDERKPNTVQTENHVTAPPNIHGSDAIFDEVEEKRLVRKIDWRLLPILGALYSIALIDRTNVRRIPTFQLSTSI